MCLWNIALPSAICCGGWAAMWWASAIVSLSSSAGGTTRLTSPSRSAVAASIELAGEQHVERALGADVAADRRPTACRRTGRC